MDAGNQPSCFLETPPEGGDETRAIFPTKLNKKKAVEQKDLTTMVVARNSNLPTCMYNICW